MVKKALTSAKAVITFNSQDVAELTDKDKEVICLQSQVGGPDAWLIRSRQLCEREANGEAERSGKGFGLAMVVAAVELFMLVLLAVVLLSLASR